MAALGIRAKGEGCAHWGNFGTTQLKKLELINPTQLITAWQSGLPLLTCCSARAESAGANHGALFCPLRFLEEHSGLGRGRAGPTESRTLGLDLFCRVQHLQFSCENKQVMRLGQGHGESQIWRKGGFCVYSHLLFIYSGSLYSLPIMGAGARRPHRPYCIPDPTFFFNASCFLL